MFPRDIFIHEFSENNESDLKMTLMDIFPVHHDGEIEQLMSCY